MSAGAGGGDETKRKAMAPYGAKSSDMGKDDGCCSVNFLKNVLHVFNIVLFLSGLGVLGVGAWTVATKHHYVVLLTTSTYALAAYVLIVAGILAVIASLLLLLGLLRENRCSILGLTFLLLLIFLMEAMVGMLSYIYEEQVEGELSLSLNDTFLQNYNVDPEKTDAIDQMQRERSHRFYDSRRLIDSEQDSTEPTRAMFCNLTSLVNSLVVLGHWVQGSHYVKNLTNTPGYKCCGAIRFEDWEFSPWHKELQMMHQKAKHRHEKFNKVPDSCCISESFLCGKSNHPSNIFGSGCLYRLGKELKSQLIILGATGLGICVVQVFGMIFSCCLYIKLRELKDYE